MFAARSIQFCDLLLETPPNRQRSSGQPVAKRSLREQKLVILFCGACCASRACPTYTSKYIQTKYWYNNKTSFANTSFDIVKLLAYVVHPLTQSCFCCRTIPYCRQTRGIALKNRRALRGLKDMPDTLPRWTRLVEHRSKCLARDEHQFCFGSTTCRQLELCSTLACSRGLGARQSTHILCPGKLSSPHTYFQLGV